MTSKDGRSANMKITSWNVDGLRAWVKKNGLDVSLQPEALNDCGLSLHFEWFECLLSGCGRRTQMFCACKRPSVLRSPYLLTLLRCPSILTSTGQGQTIRRVTAASPCCARLNPSKSLMALVSTILFKKKKTSCGDSCRECRILMSDVHKS